MVNAVGCNINGQFSDHLAFFCECNVAIGIFIPIEDLFHVGIRVFFREFTCAVCVSYLTGSFHYDIDIPYPVRFAGGDEAIVALVGSLSGNHAL